MIKYFINERNYEYWIGFSLIIILAFLIQALLVFGISETYPECLFNRSKKCNYVSKCSSRGVCSRKEITEEMRSTGKFDKKPIKGLFWIEKGLNPNFN